MTPPATFVGAKCRCATVSVDDRSEKFNEKVINPCCIVMSKLPVPAVLIGGTSFAPLRLAEKRSVCEGAADATSTLALSAAIAHDPIFVIFIVFSCILCVFTLGVRLSPCQQQPRSISHQKGSAIVTFRGVSLLFPAGAARVCLER